VQASLRSLAIAAAFTAMATSSGCSAQGNPEAEAAGSAAVSFGATARSDADAACALLAPETARETGRESSSCADGLAETDLPQAGRLREVEVYGLDAVAHLEADTVFLARFDDGWKVTAAGCTPRGDAPYDCEIKGG
jgi:hypothetical protein